jgi:hypothetical protein
MGALTVWGQINTNSAQLKQIIAQLVQTATSQSAAQNCLDILAGNQAALGKSLSQFQSAQAVFDEAILKAINDVSIVMVANQQIANAILANEKQILSLLTPPPVAGIIITFEGEDMVTRATLDIQIPDDGSRTVTANLGFVDKVGAATQPVPNATVATAATMSDPSLVASVDATGTVITISVVPFTTPPATLPTGVILSVSTTITNPDNTVLGPFSAAGSVAMDVVAGPVAGTFVIKESLN